MTLRVHTQAETWPLSVPFTISRGSRTEAHVITVEITDEVHLGRGECVPYARYGESTESVLDEIRGALPSIQEGCDRSGLAEILPPGAARNALDCALWDFEAKRSGLRAWQIASVPPPARVTTAYTIGINSPELMRLDAASNRHRPLLKIKLGFDHQLESVIAVREGAPESRLVVDANEALTPDQLDSLMPSLADIGVEMLEQPYPSDRDDPLVGAGYPLPICADESCHTVRDLDRVQARYQMVNIKLDKAGGLTSALALQHACHDLGLKTMVGCMIGTSLAMAPAFLLTDDASYVDLDGPLLLSHDRAFPLHFEDSEIDPPTTALWG